MKIRLQYLALTLFFTSIQLSCSTESIEETTVLTSENVEEVEQELLNIVNEYRINLGQNSLEFSAVAYKYANEHTNYMIAKGTANHDNFNSRATNIAAETEALLVSENVAKNYLDATEAFNGWLASTNHKKTIESEFTHTAVSVKKDASGKLYYIQLFYK